ncbi:MAG: 30S ribosomal protein S6 [Bacillota bacterium]|nr:30S ribosomal protein S6 [Bacillota bacterium]
MQKKYEAVFIVNSNFTEEETNAIVEKFKALIEANGTIEKVDVWGKRRLAYEIDDMTEGFYVLIAFESGLEFPKELDRVFTITDGILRSLIIAK